MTTELILIVVCLLGIMGGLVKGGRNGKLMILLSIAFLLYLVTLVGGRL